MAERARLERDGDLGILVIDDPPLNLFGDEIVRGRSARHSTQAGAAGARAALRAEGEFFTGGADVNVFDGLTRAQAEEFTAELLELAAPARGRCRSRRSPRCTDSASPPGFELSLACDMIWASESAQFGLVEAVVGLTPLMGGTQRIAERAGPARAREFVMSGGLYDAATLERWNVINRVLPDADLAEKSLRFAQRLAAGPTLAHAATKRIVRAAARRRRARGRRAHRGDRGAAVRDRGPAASGRRRSSSRAPATRPSRAADRLRPALVASRLYGPASPA